MTAARPPRRAGAGFWTAALATLAALAVLAGLGFWQLERAAWKRALIATLTERLAAAPGALPPPADWATLDRAGEEFRRVAFTARFDHAAEAAIFTGPSALRPDATGIGYWIMTPAMLEGGGAVMVNRGFVPEPARDPAARPEGAVAGPQQFIGVVRWPEARNFFTPQDRPDRNLWFVRDHLAIAAAKDIGPIAPFYIDLEAPVPPGGLPSPGPLRVNLPDNHLGYAITWFGLALALLVVFMAWSWSRFR